jgi:non-ribosomal peptide synthetase component F
MIRFARQHRASPTLVLAAAWVATLNRLSGQDDVVIGITVSRRDNPATAGLVASLVNVLPVRVRVPADATLASLVTDMRQQVLAGLAHQDVPLQRIVDHLNPDRVPGRAPVVHILFNQDAAGAGPAFDGVRVSPIDLEMPAGMDLDLELSVVSPADNRALGVVVRCAADLFRRATARHLLDQFTTLLDDGVARGSTQVAKLQLISATELTAVRELCTGPAPAAGRVTAPETLAQRMRERPDVPAVWAGGTPVTYGELHQSVTAAAARLAAAGVRRGSVVAVYAHRSPEMLVGMLAAWWRGAAYLPVDPGYPRRRVEYLLTDSAATAVVTTPDLRAALPVPPQRVVEFDGN